MRKRFNPLNTPVIIEVFDKNGESVLKTQSLNDASDKSVSLGEAKIIATDSKGNKKDLTL